MKVSVSPQPGFLGARLRRPRRSTHVCRIVAGEGPTVRSAGSEQLPIRRAAGVSKTDGFERKAVSGDFPFAVKGFRMAGGQCPLSFVKLFTQL
jgi:hypothetical protein